MPSWGQPRPPHLWAETCPLGPVQGWGSPSGVGSPHPGCVRCAHPMGEPEFGVQPAGTCILPWRGMETLLLWQPVLPETFQERNPGVPTSLSTVSPQEPCPLQAGATPHLSTTSAPVPRLQCRGCQGLPVYCQMSGRSGLHQTNATGSG